jgi:tetratricopeptide (TPR) repeat protein
MGMPLKSAIVSLLCVGLCAAEPRWIKLKSPDFEMYTSASEKAARETLHYFEEVRSFFVQGKVALPGKTLPIRIIAFGSTKEYTPYAPNDFTSAFYHHGITSDDIVLSQIGSDAFPMAVHEYVHLVLKHLGLKLPLWLNEGMAELYSTMKPVGDKVLVGNLLTVRHEALLRDQWVPLAPILEADANSSFYRTKEGAAALYNEGWALAHMMVLTSEYRPGFAKFLDTVSTGMPTAQALKEVYGKTVAQVDHELQVYIHGTHFQGAYFGQSPEKVNDQVDVEPAAPFDVKLALAVTLSRDGRYPDCKAAMEELIKDDPNRPETYVQLANVALLAKDSEEAVRQFAKAFAHGDREAPVLWDYGRLLRGRNQQEAIRVLSALLTQEPARDIPVTSVRLELAAEQLMAQQPQAALDTLTPITWADKDDAPRLFGIVTHAQLDLGRWADARKSALALAKVARRDDDKLMAQQALQIVDAREGRPTAMRGSIAGAFMQVDCSGASQKLVLDTDQGKKVFLIDDPGKILGGSMTLTCGAQNQDRVRVDFDPPNQPGIDGLVRGIRVEP